MIVDPINFYERLAAEIMREITSKNLLAVDCCKMESHGEEGCMMQVRFVSGAMEQLSGLIAEMLEVCEDE